MISRRMTWDELAHQNSKLKTKNKELKNIINEMLSAIQQSSFCEKCEFYKYPFEEGQIVNDHCRKCSWWKAQDKALGLDKEEEYNAHLL